MNKTGTAILFLLAFIGTWVFAQSSVNSSGMESNSQSASVSWSLGELVVGDNLISEGFYSLSDISSLVSSIQNDFGLDIEIYPNPSTDLVNLKFISDQPEISFNLFTSSGKKTKAVLFKKNQKLYQLDIRRLKKGIYHLIASHKTSGKTTYKIIKE